MIKANSDFVFQVEDLRNGALEEVHASRLKFYSDSSLNKKAIFSHVISSETGMAVARRMGIEEEDGKMFVVVRWKGLSKLEDTRELLEQVYEDVPKMLIRLLSRKSTSSDLRAKVKSFLGLS